jgi:hypothetical protein
MMERFFLLSYKYGNQMRNLISLILLLLLPLSVEAVGGNDYYQYSVELTNMVSNETGKPSTAYLWIPDGCKRVKAVILAQQNMTEETIFKMDYFRKQMKTMDIALMWVAPAFSQKWDPQTPCQSTFEEMMTAIAYQAGHEEIAKVPIIPLGHSAQATFPWNFAAWNPDRTLCIISFHGDAPRTNLCGFGTSNIEWGRYRNIDGIPGLMVEGEFEWWEKRVTPALAFRMMYPESCVSFLCDTGRGHFDCGQPTAMYIAKFIKKSLEQRLQADGMLKKINPQDGWLAERYHADIPANDGTDQGVKISYEGKRYTPAPYAQYKGDKHDAFWYFDKEMAELTEARYRESAGKKVQYMGFEFQGALVPVDNHAQCGMSGNFVPDADGITIHIKAVYTDSTHVSLSNNHSKAHPHIEVISGPIKKINDTTFRVYPYEAGFDNPRRCLNFLLVAVGDPDGDYRGAVQPITFNLPKDIFIKMNNLR